MTDKQYQIFKDLANQKSFYFDLVHDEETRELESEIEITVDGEEYVLALFINASHKEWQTRSQTLEEPAEYDSKTFHEIIELGVYIDGDTYAMTKEQQKEIISIIEPKIEIE